MNRKPNYTSQPGWQKVQTVLKRAIIRLHGAGVIPDNQVKVLFDKLRLRQA